MCVDLENWQETCVNVSILQIKCLKRQNLGHQHLFPCPMYAYLCKSFGMMICLDIL